MRLHFEEFVRLQIGNNPAAGFTNWYIVSGPFAWKTHIRYRFDGTIGPAGEWVENGSFQLLDNVGF